VTDSIVLLRFSCAVGRDSASWADRPNASLTQLHETAFAVLGA